MSSPVRSEQVAARQDALSAWLFGRSANDPYTVLQIVDISGLYDDFRDKRATCLADLRRLEDKNLVIECAGRPTRWRSRNA